MVFITSVLCRCLVPMREIARTDVTDGVSWYCPHCKSRKSIRDGIFFSKSHITLQKWMILIHYWIAQESVTSAARNSETSMVTAINVYQWLREVCSQRLIRDGPAQLGGRGKVVEVDESCFKHKPKVSTYAIIIILFFFPVP